MKRVAIIQARMGSTRLRGKVLKDIGGETMLGRVVRRAQQAATLDQVVIATTAKASDEAIVAEAVRLGVPVFRGSEQDVLDRYYTTAAAVDAEVVVRITADCPFIDPQLTDQIIHAFMLAKVDYASNALDRTYPRGTVPEVMRVNALARAWKQAEEHYQRVHVTPYIYHNPDKFVLLSFKGEGSHSDYRWSVDTPEDLEFARSVYAALGNRDSFGWRDVLGVLNEQPKLIEINRHIKQKTLEEG